MGKNFPAIFSLSEKPHLLGQTLGLIEKSFGYEAPFRFEKDFAPLMAERNHPHNYILLDESENVIAHLGARVSALKLQQHHFPLCMLGGIAVDEGHRGKGYLSSLMNHAISELRDEVSAFVLWSNQDLYQRYGFNLCGEQFESSSTPSAQIPFKKTKYHLLSFEEKKQIQKLYQLSLLAEPGLARSEKDWMEVESIEDADLYIERKGESIESYFFVGKGQDLQGIAHEFGSLDSLSELRKRARKISKVWGPVKISQEDTLQYQFMLLPGDRRIFTDLIKAYTQNRIEIILISHVHQKIEFRFEGVNQEMKMDEFLRGIFGPGRFEELRGLKPVFIRGLDSI